MRPMGRMGILRAAAFGVALLGAGCQRDAGQEKDGAANGGVVDAAAGTEVGASDSGARDLVFDFPTTLDSVGAPDVGAPDEADVRAVVSLIDPVGLVADGSGNLFVYSGFSTSDMARLLRIAVARDTASVIADRSALFESDVASMVADGAGGLFITTGFAATVLHLDIATGRATTIAGAWFQQDHVDDVGTAARFLSTGGVAADGRGNLYIVDHEARTIRKLVLATGHVTTLAGAPRQTGKVDAVGADARFESPADIAYDASTDTLYVGDYTTVRRIDPTTGAVTTLAGTGRAGTLSDGIGVNASFDFVGSFALDGAGGMYVADRATIRKINLATAEVKTFAGHVGASVSRDGTATTAYIRDPDVLALDGRGTLYFTSCQTIRKLDLASGAITTLYGFPDEVHRALLGCVTNGRPLTAD